MDKKQELIKLCRYYKGEDKCPIRLKELGYHAIWRCERDWVFWESQNAFEKGTFSAPYGYSIIWDKNIEIPFIAGYDIPSNLLKMLFSFYCYFAGVHPRDISTKKVSSLQEKGGWIRVSVKEGFRIFLEERYCTEVSKSHSITK